MEKRSGSLKTNFSQIARELGISRGTVYRVVNHSPLVKPETRAKVISALNRNGYFRHRQIHISKVLFDFCDNKYLRDLGNKLMAVMPEKEYICHCSDHRRNLEDFLNSVAESDTVVFVSNPSDKIITAARHVNPDIYTVTLTTVTITPNNKLGGELAARHLFACGQKNIAVFLAESHPTRIERYKSFLGEFTLLDPDAEIKEIHMSGNDEFYSVIADFLSSCQVLPDVIFFPAGGFAQTFYEEFASRDSIYGAIGIMSYDRPEDIFPPGKEFRYFDRIEFNVQDILDWAEYYITNRPMMQKRSPVHTCVEAKLVTAGSVLDKNKRRSDK